jgi:ABC-type transport system involved in cytochrome c biogenesis permease subunit
MQRNTSTDPAGQGGPFEAPRFGAESARAAGFCPARDIRRLLLPLASLKLTVVLFALAIVIVLTGTFAQTDLNERAVQARYFSAWVVWIDFQVFFPKSFFPSEPKIPGGIWFPGGALIGLAMLVNLLAAHTLRFTIQAQGQRFWSGLAVLAVGALTTWLVIASGTNKQGIQESAWAGRWDQLWTLFQGGMALLSVLSVAGALALPRQRWSERLLLWGCAAALAGVFVLTLYLGPRGRLDDSYMRILWQLIKGGFAAAVLLAGCILLFRKRAGIVLLHGGIALMMFGQMFTEMYAVEAQMSIPEGESRNYAENITQIELAVVEPAAADAAHDSVAVIPGRELVAGRTIRDDALPFAVRVEQFLPNSVLVRAAPSSNPATEGFGLQQAAEPRKASSGADSSGRIDMPSAYVTLLRREGGQPLGTYLVSLWLPPQDVYVDGRTYELSLRHRREYKSYTITLHDVQRIDYPGTRTPRDYSSYIRLVDPLRGADFERRIWMNNPLRFGGETFYQSGYHGPPDVATETTVLQIVSNTGWMVPYVSCMIVATGMLTQFVLTLLRFLTRRATTAAASAGAVHGGAGQGGGAPSGPESVVRSASRRGRTASSLEAALPLEGPPSRAGTLALWALPCAVGVLYSSLVLWQARPVRQAADDFHWYDAARLPVMHEGRVKPLDTLARSFLRIVSDRETYRDPQGRSQPPVRWLLDTTLRREVGNTLQVVRIRNDDVLQTLRLEDDRRQGNRYAINELLPRLGELAKQADLARNVQDRAQLTAYQRKVLELEQRLGVIDLLVQSLQVPVIDRTETLDDLLAAVQHVERLQRREPPLLLASRPDGHWETYAAAAARAQLQRLARAHDRMPPIQTPAELAAYLVQTFPDEHVRASIHGVYLMLSRVRQELGDDASLIDLAKEAVRRSDSRAFRLLLVHVLQSRDDVEQMAATLPDDLRQALLVEGTLELVGGYLEALPRDVWSKQVPVMQLADASKVLDTPLPDDSDPLVRRQAEDRRRDALRLLTSALERLATLSIERLLAGASLTAPPSPRTEAFERIVAAYERQDTAAFNAALAEYQHQLAAALPPETSLGRVAFETYFNHVGPFNLSSWLYLGAFVLGCLALLGWTRAWNRAALAATVVALAVHLFAIVGRIVISGRPPVTNLYSSAVFIALAAVVMGLIIEAAFRLGFANLVGSFLGFGGLYIGHLLNTEVPSFKGDTVTVLQAVLDTQFWLATHVVCITLGYTATFLAGMLGVKYILRGVLTPSLTPQVKDALTRMIYGTLCFAIFFSFVGTVLGGLWADDSWGRFWGWDPKENGALIIVLWNALVLHARWDGWARQRALAALAVGGNIVTAWSWFGVNELGIGLHSYGFTEGVLLWLGIFVASQLLVIALGCLPKTLWWSEVRHVDPRPSRRGKS